MVDRIERARRAVDAAADETDDATVREQLRSIDEGLAAIGEEPDDAEKGHRLEAVEAKLVGLGDEVDNVPVHRRIEDARDQVDAYRREDAPDW